MLEHLGNGRGDRNSQREEKRNTSLVSGPIYKSWDANSSGTDTPTALLGSPGEKRKQGTAAPKIGGTTRGAQRGTHRIRLVHKAPLDPGLPEKPDFNLRNLLEVQVVGAP